MSLISPIINNEEFYFDASMIEIINTIADKRDKAIYMSAVSKTIDLIFKSNDVCISSEDLCKQINNVLLFITQECESMNAEISRQQNLKRLNMIRFHVDGSKYGRS